MGICFPVRWATNTALMAPSDAARYTVNTSSSSGTVRVGKVPKHFLSSSKALVASSVHLNSDLKLFRRTSMNGNDRSAAFDKKRWRAANRPFKDWISLTDAGGFIVRTASILSGLARKPFDPTMTPRNLPSSTPNVHFFGFNFILMLRSRVNVSSISFIIAASS
ncbi:hypothetical protein HanHA300_Chr10g0377071 [Helianthus annuus]|nr:hypothetical protein HanHA300_Chr10g0377071 [Helianthus annuus]KAJ0531296.1 hypothetical protein HanHA89_Chr10g0399561 [Helianthus annuus]KAJ0698132.1 hypothetical protein HanLR1_Chr10g0376751 [Helianthus annuus]